VPTLRPPVGGTRRSKQKVDREQPRHSVWRLRLLTATVEHIMANVRVEQRNAHLGGPVRLETVLGRDGEISKAVLTAIRTSTPARHRS